MSEKFDFKINMSEKRFLKETRNLLIALELLKYIPSSTKLLKYFQCLDPRVSQESPKYFKKLA